MVLKFGGTSVSSLANWSNIARVAAEREAGGARVLIVHSALAGVTDQLGRLLDTAIRDSPEEELRTIEQRHCRLAAELGVPVPPEVERQLAELREIAAGISMVREVSERTRARVMAAGELLLTPLAVQFLTSQGLRVQSVDARTLLRAERQAGAARGSVLSAVCAFAPDAALRGRLEEGAPIIVTQGFIATDDEGQTVLLGRGGSDTSAAYLAAKLSAQRLEIWTDVPGMFSANPRATPSARLLRTLHYDEAQEIATSGAKVLHPRCILPARQYGIPLHVYSTQVPDLEGTVLSAEGSDGTAQVKAVCTKKGLTLISLESPGMWHQVGFLADAFQVFKQHGLSVALVSTSETNVTVSLDPAANTLDNTCVSDLVTDLARLCRVHVIGPCASVSLVGRNTRAILHQLGGAFEFFEEQKIHLVSQAANDLNFTFVVDENQGDRLVEQLHELLIRPVPGDKVLGPTWQQLFARGPAADAPAAPWWRVKRGALLAALGDRDAAFVYDLDVARSAARARRDQPRALLDEGQSASAAAARVAHRGHRVRVRVAWRGRASARAFSRPRAAASPVYAELRTARRVLLGSRAGRTRHGRQRLRTGSMASAVCRPRDLRTRRHRGRPRAPHSRAHRRQPLEIWRSGRRAPGACPGGQQDRRAGERPRGSRRQRYFRCHQLGAHGAAARRGGGRLRGGTRYRCRWGIGRSGAYRSAGSQSGGPRHAPQGGARRTPPARDLA